MRVYNSQMIRLSEEHPNIYKYFTGGGFSVQISKETLLTKLLKKPQARIPQTAGAGVSTKPSAVSKYYLNAEYRSTAIDSCVIKIDSPHRIHLDLQLKNQSVLELPQTGWTNPFKKNPM